MLQAPMVNGSGVVYAMGGKGGATIDGRQADINLLQGCYDAQQYGSPGGNGEGGRIVLTTPTVHHGIQMSVCCQSA